MATHAIQDTLSDEIFDAPENRTFPLDLAPRIRAAMKDIVNGKVVRTDEMVYAISDQDVCDIWSEFECTRSSELLAERVRAAYAKLKEDK